MNVRRAGLVVLGLAGLVGAAAKAQMAAADAPAAVAACGSREVKFEVKESPQPTKSQAGGSRVVGAAPEGKAMVYLVEDVGHLPLHTITLRVGVDGKWVGAARNSTYVSFAVDPGIHHLCVSEQGRAAYQLERGITLRRLDVKAGEIYYLRAREIQAAEGVLPVIFLDKVDEDEGQFLIQTILPAEWNQKK